MKIKYICQYCDKEFDNENDCKAHEKIHVVKDWTTEDYITWLHNAADEIVKNQTVKFGYQKTYLQFTLLGQKPIQVVGILNNIADMLGNSKKPIDSSTESGATSTSESNTNTESTGSEVSHG